MQIIDGRKMAAEIISKLKSEVFKLSFKPVFCDILVGDDPVSSQYVNLKASKAQSIGIEFLKAEYPAAISTEDLIWEIKKINGTQNICGLIVQLPLPEGLDRRHVLDAISPKIDVDLIGSQAGQQFYAGDLTIIPPTSAAVLEMLDSLDLNLNQQKILVIGQGELVGRPVAFLLKKRNLNFDIADKYTKNILELMAKADVIISGAGRPKLITGDKIKKGAIIIDAGTAEDNGEIVGDVDMASVKEKASFASPVPGGVGPVTVSMLLKNVVKVAQL